jgi:primosomal protein N' (replication factor Y)
MVGVVLACGEEKPHDFPVRAIKSVVDQQPVYSPQLLRLAQWISDYYFHPIGEVFKTMLPASSSQSVKETWSLTQLALDSDVLDVSELGLVRQLFARRSKLSSATLKRKLETINRESEGSLKLTLQSLRRKKYIEVSRSKEVRVRKSKRARLDSKLNSPEVQARPTLTNLQEQALNQIKDELLLSPSERKPVLLHGVTGSGKTEIYLQLIEYVQNEISKDAQVLVMVPEISLTPQMTAVFAQRFPKIVSVVHSAMSDQLRWQQLEAIRSGEAKVLIGPRSAIFGPFRQLSLILVDEEHDQSYKQSSGVLYHGRDVAIVRAKMEQALVVLGSATPSLESYQNSLLGKYKRVTMPERVSGRPLPEVELVSTATTSRSGIAVVDQDNRVRPPSPTQETSPIAMEIIEALKANFASGQQSIVLVNRRGYAFYLFDMAQKKPLLCPHCSISMTLHAKSTVLHCHYCDFSTKLEKVVKEHPTARFVAVGYGSQKAEDYLNHFLPDAKISRLDSDILSDRELLPKTLDQFRQRKIDILVGTQILAKGHDFPNVTLTVILDADQLLSLPDFRAGERTFQLIVQAAGRSGRAEHKGKVMVQTSRPDHPIVQAGLHYDFEGYVHRELSFRQNHGYPPFAKMACVEFNSEKRDKLESFSRRIENWIDHWLVKKPELFSKVKISGPLAPMIEMVRGRHRRSVLFLSADHLGLEAVLRGFWSTFQTSAPDIRIRLDRDPQSMI